MISMPRTVIAASLALLSLASCSGPKDGEAPVSTMASAAPSSAETPSILAADAAPWYAEPMEALGFFVFPRPEPMPPFEVAPLAGGRAGLGDAAGKVVLLNFWATWCPPCRSEMPSIQRLHDAMAGRPFAVMAVSVAESAATVRAFLKTDPYTFPIYLDEGGRASGPFVGRGIPTTFVLDKQGRAIAGVIGARSYDDPEVLALFKALAERL
ncbi:MAG TPA: TlpA disulfide reductase family protein [Spirochaetales bacterium]|nr:TlpA disulfide reductase family protein [Spirochaetales bacterium]